jgi:pimeloyl-ACP methyl ester carboxylesterase
MKMFTQEILVQLDADRYAKLFVRVWKPEASIGTVFCIHGFTGNGSDFEYLADFLAANNYTVVCPDMLGRGLSAYLGEGANYDFNLYAKCLRALDQFSGRENHYIGTSWGGTIALIYLYMVRARVTKVVLNDVPMLGGVDVDGIRAEIVKDSQALFATRAEARDYVRSTRRFMGPVEEQVLARYIDNKIIETPAGFRLAYDPATTGNFAAMTGREYDLYALVAKINARFLFLYGRDSGFNDREAFDRARTVRPDLWRADNVDAGHPPSLMTLDQAMLILGFLTAA